jgi:serine/threonine protein kinase
VVHRDLSPNNVMISARGEVKIIDFGLAAAKVDHFHTEPGMVLGTLRYAAPEQASSGHADRRSDLYMVGAVLYEMLTNVPVVATREPAEILQAVLTAEPKALRELAPGVSEALEQVVRSALARDPEGRPQDAATFAERLRGATRELPRFGAEELARMLTDLHPYSDTATTLIAAETTASESTASEPEGTVELRRPTKISLVAAMLLCFAVLALSFAAVRTVLERPAPQVERRR